MSEVNQSYQEALAEAIRKPEEIRALRYTEELDAYQYKATDFALYKGKMPPLVYPALGLVGEAGEVADKIKKIYRDSDGNVTQEQLLGIAKELSDVLWYLAALSGDMGFKLSEIAAISINKLNARKEANTIQGSGDNR